MMEPRGLEPLTFALPALIYGLSTKLHKGYKPYTSMFVGIIFFMDCQQSLTIFGNWHEFGTQKAHWAPTFFIYFFSQAPRALFLFIKVVRLCVQITLDYMTT